MNPRGLHAIVLLACVIASLLCGSALAEAAQRILWEKVPIALALRVGVERIVHFPGPVSLGVPQSHVRHLRAQSLDGTLYLMAHEAFEPVRIQVRSTDGGPIYLLDVEASDHAPPGSTVQVELAPALVAHSNSPGSARSPGYVALTRFAARQLYAPRRLAGDVPGIVRVPVSRQAHDLVRGANIEARAIASWRSHSLFVTAVQLTNRSSLGHTLDARSLRGNWLAATFQHRRLHATGSGADTTVVYLISAHPFEQARTPVP